MNERIQPTRKTSSSPPPHTDHTGAFVLALLAAAAFSGWYLMVWEHPSDSKPLAVVQRPLMPPEAVDTSSQLPGHKHYIVLGPDAPAGASGRGN
jgi:hypothetical protein